MPRYRCRIRQVWVIEVELTAADEEAAREKALTPMQDVPELPEYEGVLGVEVEAIAAAAAPVRRSAG